MGSTDPITIDCRGAMWLAKDSFVNRRDYNSTSEEKPVTSTFTRWISRRSSPHHYLLNMSSDGDNNISTPVAVASCVVMALFYVLILYAPTVILRLPSPSSFYNFMIRRFVCAAISTVASLAFTVFILPVSFSYNVRVKRLKLWAMHTPLFAVKMLRLNDCAMFGTMHH